VYWFKERQLDFRDFGSQDHSPVKRCGTTNQEVRLSKEETSSNKCATKVRPVEVCPTKGLQNAGLLLQQELRGVY
jgi:hypothetical protein